MTPRRFTATETHPGTVFYDSADGARWAEVRVRDWPTAHAPSFVVERSDGVTLAGEFGPYFAHRRAALWVLGEVQ